MKLGPDSIESFDLDLQKNDRILIVQSLFNREITDNLVEGAKKSLGALGFKDEQIKVLQVSGAVEIPLITKMALKTKKYLGAISLGAIIKGDTPHFDYVCQMISRSLSQISLKQELPIGFGILTTNNLIEAQERSKDNEFNKGRESALALIRQLVVIKEIHINRKY